MIVIKNKDAIRKMQEAGKLTSHLFLTNASAILAPGVSYFGVWISWIETAAAC